MQISKIIVNFSFVIIDSRKNILRHHPDMTDIQAEKYSKYAFELSNKSKSAIRDINPHVFYFIKQNDLLFLRIRAKNSEILIAPSIFLLLLDDDFIVTLTQSWVAAPLPPPPTPPTQPI